jgi:dipeptidyl aminopeptidase/acylaminoacyl peptidase
VRSIAIVALLMIPAVAGDAPEHAEIAFVSDGRIWAARADGSERRPLARGAQPAWSPDGTRLAYVRGKRLIVDGRPLTPRQKGVEVSSPAWSPDGTALAFDRFTVKGNRYRTMIVVRDLATGAERVLVTANLLPRLDAVSAPAWSPDGATIAYTHSRLDSEADIRPDIRTVPAAGGASRLLIRDAQAPAWSPDGGRLAFASVRDRNGKICSSDECWFAGEIYTAAADGSDLRRLTDNEGDDTGPRWSPDGSRILFASDRNRPSRGGIWTEAEEVYSIAADGSCLTWVTNGTPASGAATWRPASGIRFDPGSCDPSVRAPRVDRPRLARSRMWLGTRYDGLLLSDLREGVLRYGDCARFDGCGPAVELARGTRVPRSPRRRFRTRGFVVHYDGPNRPAYAVKGRAVTLIWFDDRNTLAGVRRVARHLRRFR